MNDIILTASNLKKTFPIHGGIFYRKIARVNALNGVSFSLKRGRTLGVVGESGCGKSTLGKTLLRLYEPDSGGAVFEGRDVFSLKPDALLKLRQDMQMIFQDPYASLNPRMTVGSIIGEPLNIHRIGTREDRKKKVEAILAIVGMRKEALSRYPHEFSGGQRQRIGIARALALRPKLIIADEPVSALDVSIQSQIINLMIELQREFGITYIFIAHNLAVVEYVSDEVAVMYLGHIVEIAEKRALFNRPSHPYTLSLLSAIPVPEPDLKNSRERIILKGDVPSPIHPPSGCPFHPRCFKATEECRHAMPVLDDVAGDGALHKVACFNR
ncbi:MAG: dipeptide ABC transporter ATP-binding protein [Deltaproteobacteria bacterium]|nr:dipeptide ABC transporter ATP-binding protein [Deltaproteobacteria bacterium]